MKKEILIYKILRIGLEIFYGTETQKNPDATDVFRVKGVVSIIDSENKYILQGVHTMFDFRQSKVIWSMHEKKATHLLFTGRNIALLQNSFRLKLLK